MVLFDNSPWWHFAAFACVIFAGFELLNFIVMHGFAYAKSLPMQGKHLDVLSSLDVTFIRFNRVVSVMFTYHVLRFTVLSPAIVWRAADATLGNTLGALGALFVFYDFFYCLFHRGLHRPEVYRFVHKHHHKQFAPSRGNTDALNVHPFEFISGEYLHLFSLAAVGSVLNVHVWTVACFIIAGGVLASLNHTRYDVSLPSHSHWVFSVALHDVHHSVGQNKNFSQYHPLWDKIFGSFQAWAPPLAGKQK